EPHVVSPGAGGHVYAKFRCVNAVLIEFGVVGVLDSYRLLEGPPGFRHRIVTVSRAHDKFRRGSPCVAGKILVIDTRRITKEHALWTGGTAAFTKSHRPGGGR